MAKKLTKAEKEALEREAAKRGQLAADKVPFGCRILTQEEINELVEAGEMIPLPPGCNRVFCGIKRKYPVEQYGGGDFDFGVWMDVLPDENLMDKVNQTWLAVKSRISNEADPLLRAYGYRGMGLGEAQEKLAEEPEPRSAAEPKEETEQVKKPEPKKDKAIDWGSFYPWAQDEHGYKSSTGVMNDLKRVFDDPPSRSEDELRAAVIRISELRPTTDDEWETLRKEFAG